MIKVTRCEHVDNPYYKMVVENPRIITVKHFFKEEEANKYINDDIDAYLKKYKGNDIKYEKIQIPWQIGCSLTDNSRFGGLGILYMKETE